jgi:hypothetical protein
MGAAGAAQRVPARRRGSGARARMRRGPHGTRQQPQQAAAGSGTGSARAPVTARIAGRRAAGSGALVRRAATARGSSSSKQHAASGSSARASSALRRRRAAGSVQPGRLAAGPQPRPPPHPPLPGPPPPDPPPPSPHLPPSYYGNDDALYYEDYGHYADDAFGYEDYYDSFEKGGDGEGGAGGAKPAPAPGAGGAKAPGADGGGDGGEKDLDGDGEGMPGGDEYMMDDDDEFGSDPVAPPGAEPLKDCVLEGGKPKLADGTAPCPLLLKGADERADLLRGGIDGTYKLTGCHNGRPLYTRDKSPPGEDRVLWYSTGFGDWDVSNGTAPNEAEILLYGGDTQHAVVPLYVTGWYLGADLNGDAGGMGEDDYFPVSVKARGGVWGWVRGCACVCVCVVLFRAGGGGACGAGSVSMCKARAGLVFWCLLGVVRGAPPISVLCVGSAPTVPAFGVGACWQRGRLAR